MQRHGWLVAGMMTALVGANPAAGQGRPDPTAMMAAQRAAMAPLASLDGVWRGPATLIGPTGERRTLTQTERVGPFVEGTVKVVEGRGYEADGALEFNAFGTISYDPGEKRYVLRSYAQGQTGEFALTLTADGVIWERQAGPMVIRYTVVLADGHWREVGDRIMPGKDPIRFYEADLVRLGDSDWPAAGAVGPK